MDRFWDLQFHVSKMQHERMLETLQIKNYSYVNELQNSRQVLGSYKAVKRGPTAAVNLLLDWAVETERVLEDEPDLSTAWYSRRSLSNHACKSCVWKSGCNKDSALPSSEYLQSCGEIPHILRMVRFTRRPAILSIFWNPNSSDVNFWTTYAEADNSLGKESQPLSVSLFLLCLFLINSTLRDLRAICSKDAITKIPQQSLYSCNKIQYRQTITWKASLQCNSIPTYQIETSFSNKDIPESDNLTHQALQNKPNAIDRGEWEVGSVNIAEKKIASVLSQNREKLNCRSRCTPHFVLHLLRVLGAGDAEYTYNFKERWRTSGNGFVHARFSALYQCSGICEFATLRLRLCVLWANFWLHDAYLSHLQLSGFSSILGPQFVHCRSARVEMRAFIIGFLKAGSGWVLETACCVGTR